MATTKTEYKLEKEDISNTSSTTVKIDMKEESSEDQLAVDEDIALVQASIMVMNENELGAQVFLMSFRWRFSSQKWRDCKALCKRKIHRIRRL